VGTNLNLLNLACPERGNPNSPIRHIEVRYGFPPAGDDWEVEDIESIAQGEARPVIKVVYDDPPESVADASTSARRPMVDDPAPDPTPEDFGL
jgi:hypothetical protein